jgi:ATP-dependent Clp endopeptidase proteolytic subunit ClpP
MGNWYAIQQTENNEAEISIYDEIGGFGVGAKQFLADVAKLDGKQIHLRINSPGGSVIEGTAIYNALRRHKGGVTVHIDALAASMASVIAMAGDNVYMADNALMMVHNPWTITAGDSADLRKEADLLDKLKNNIRNAYQRKTGIKDEELQSMMDAETWLDAVDAVALGFVDAIEDGIEAAALSTPKELRQRFDNFAKNMTQNYELETMPETLAPETLVEVPAPEVTEAEEIIVEAPAPEAEPQASAMNVSALVEKVQALITERDSALAKVEFYKAEAARDRQDYDRLARSLGMTGAAQEPVIVPEAQAAQSVMDKYNSITDPAERSAFYRKHRDEIMKAALG